MNNFRTKDLFGFLLDSLGPKWSHTTPSPASMSKFPSGGKVFYSSFSDVLGILVLNGPHHCMVTAVNAFIFLEVIFHTLSPA